MHRSRWSLFPLLAGVLWLGLATLMPRLTSPALTSHHAAIPQTAPSYPAAYRGRITPADPGFDILAQAYRRHADVVEYQGRVWLADDNGQTLNGFVAIAELPTPEAMDTTIQIWWHRFYQDTRWGDWSQDWLSPEWLGPLAEPLGHALICRERRCLVGHDFDNEVAWQLALGALRERLPAHVELRELRTPSHALLVFTRY